MWADEPSWWYREDASLPARLLAPVSRLWELAAERRYRRGAQVAPGIPVVCIGNFTAGGTGKTPLALLVAGILAELGARPAFLSRGHGGSNKGPHWVATGHDTAADVGDEPLLLATAAPTMIARDRAAGALEIASSTRHGAIVMDDGLQNGSVAKSLTIGVVDGLRGIGNGLVIPAGPLRAALEWQLQLADAIVVNTPEGAGEARNGFVGGLRGRFAGPVLTATTRVAENAEWLRGTVVVAFCGIGAPQRFFDTLERLGARPVVREAFPDHHRFTETEAQRLLALAGEHSAVPVTTQKDYVRMSGQGAVGTLKDACRVLPIRVELAERDALRLRGLLEGLFAGGATR